MSGRVILLVVGVIAAILLPFTVIGTFRGWDRVFSSGRSEEANRGVRRFERIYGSILIFVCESGIVFFTVWGFIKG